MFKIHWKSFVSFVLLMTALSTVVVQYGVDAQFRGYPLPFLTIESGIADKASFGWRIPNLLLSLGLCAGGATAALAASNLRVAARDWLFAGLGVMVVIGVATYTLWHSVNSPITRADTLERAMAVSTTIRHLLGAGALASGVCFFVFFLRRPPTIRRAE